MSLRVSVYVESWLLRDDGGRRDGVGGVLCAVVYVVIFTVVKGEMIGHNIGLQAPLASNPSIQNHGIIFFKFEK